MDRCKLPTCTLTWSMFADLKLMSSCADAAVPLAASIARPWTNSLRESEPFSKRLKRLEKIDSMEIAPSLPNDIGMTIVEQFSTIGEEDQCNITNSHAR